MLTDPVRVPSAVGVKVTVIVQLALIATLLPQVLVCAKSPLAAMLLMVNVAVPVFLSVTFCEAFVVPTCWPLNVRLLGVSLTKGASPVPVRLTVCGLPAALSVTLTFAVLVPFAVGVKVTVMVQLAPAATDFPQLFVCA